VSWIGLAAIALGTGGIKPCVSAFGGDQFLPGQEAQLQKFFSLFYISINAGSLLSTFITPILREDVQCFERQDCFPLAFGVPAILMIVALLLFLLGKFLTNYRIVPPSNNNIVVQVVKCVFVSQTLIDSTKFKLNKFNLFIDCFGKKAFQKWTQKRALARLCGR